MRRAGAVAAAAVLAAFAIAVAIPFATEEREYPAAIPQASPLYFTSVVKVKAGSEACFRDAVIEPHSEEARFRVGTVRRPGAPLVVRIRGAGYSETVRVRGGYADNTELRLPVEPPARATPVRVCIENLGPDEMHYYAAGDRTRSRSRAYVDGRPNRSAVVFSFWEREKRSIAGRFPVTIERMTVFRPAFVGEWLLWPLAILFALGIPAAVVWGYARSLGDSESSSSSPPGSS